jgi:hypothetical protein
MYTHPKSRVQGSITDIAHLLATSRSRKKVASVLLSQHVSPLLPPKDNPSLGLIVTAFDFMKPFSDFYYRVYILLLGFSGQI